MNGKQVVFVVLGVVASCVIFMFLCVYILDGGEAIRLIHLEAGEKILLMLFVIVTVSLLVGGIVTGFLSYPLDTKWKLLWITPGLYIVIWMSFLMLLPSLLAFLSMLFFFLLFFLYFYLVSLAGTGLGYFLRGLIRRLCKSG